MAKKVMKKKIMKRIAPRKPKPPPDTTRDDIHAILSEYDGEEALRRIREVLYGPAPVEKTDE